MKTVQFLAYLRGLDVDLRVDGEQLQVDAPEGVLSPDLIEQLSTRKTELLRFFREQQQPDSEPIEPTPRDVDLVLSHAQQRLWFLDQLEPGSGAYIMPSATRLRGELDVPALERSLTELVRRHESLRTTFDSRAGVPRQVIHAPEPVAVPIVDLSTLHEPERLATAERLALENSSRPFDLANGPLFRVQLLRLGEAEHVLLTAFHHIVFDAWSGGVFAREFAALYKAFRTDQPSPLPDPRLQYTDFAAWQRRRLDGGGRDAHLAYWRERLGDDPPALELPSDRPRRASGPVAGASCSARIGAERTSTIREVSHQQGVTPSMVLLSAFNALLHRLSGKSDINIGAPVAGRDRPETENLIGFFINTVVLRTSVTSAMSFRELLQSVRDTTVEAYAHQEMPFEELVSAIAPHRDTSRTPIFQVFFNHLNVGEPTQLDIPGVIAEPFGQSTPKSKFDLTLYVHERAESIDLRVVYSADLFDKIRIVGLLDQYVQLLDQLCRAPLLPIGRHSLVTTRASAVLPDPYASVLDGTTTAGRTLVCAELAAHGSSVALRSGAEAWTYAQLDARANRLARILAAGGVRRGDVVAVLAKREPLLVCTLLGILRSGAAFTVLDQNYPDSRLADAWRIASPVGVVRVAGVEQPGPLLAQAVAASAPRVDIEASIGSLEDAEASADIELPAVSPDDLAYIAFTSGTTGGVKAIEGTHGPVAHFLEWQRRTFGIRPADRFSLLSGLSHDPLLRDIFAPLWTGAALEIPTADVYADPLRLGEWIAACRVSVMHATPALAEAMLGGPHTLPHLRYAFFGGDRLRASIVAALRRAAPNASCVNFYGTTETPQAMGYWPVDTESQPREVASLGRGIDGVQLLVMNGEGVHAGIGELGEICVRSAHLSRGYRGDEQLTRERFTHNPFTGRTDDRLYRTGDLGRYLPDGAVEYAGRRDDQVKIRGFRVELGDVEATLREFRGIKDAAVVLRERDGDAELAACIVTHGSTPVPMSDVREFLAARLPEHAVPSFFVDVDALPLSPNGKVDRAALAIEAFVVSGGPAKPRRLLTPLENQLLVIWEQVLGRDGLQVTDNFFEMGGNSLTAVRLFSQLRKLFGKDLPLATLFQAPTVEKLAALMHDAGRSTRWKSLVAIQPEGSKAPLFMVPGVGGNVLEFARLANLIGPDQPFYGAQSRGLDGSEPPLRAISEMAREYLKEIRELQPHGPYHLGGACMGGIVAFEMAQQLEASGEKVALLALIDTPLVRSLSRRRYRLLAVLHPIYFVCQGTYRHLLNLRGKGLSGWIDGIRAVLRIVRQMVQERDVYRGDRNVFYQDLVTAANYEAMSSYVPSEYSGRLHLFVASERAVNPAHYSRLDWAKFAAGGFSVFRINAKDSGELLRSPYVTELAQRISEAMSRESRSGSE